MDRSTDVPPVLFRVLFIAQSLTARRPPATPQVPFRAFQRPSAPLGERTESQGVRKGRKLNVQVERKGREGATDYSRTGIGRARRTADGDKRKSQSYLGLFVNFSNPRNYCVIVSHLPSLMIIDPRSHIWGLGHLEQQLASAIRLESFTRIIHAFKLGPSSQRSTLILAVLLS